MTDFNFVSRYVKPRFPLGKIVLTANVVRALKPGDIGTALLRHAEGDWGDVSPRDRDANDVALWGELRVKSVYHGRSGVPFWVITEADRSATTVLLPEDY